MLSNKIMGTAKAVEPSYIEDIFSTYLYTGNSSTQTITNGIDLAGEGGLVWGKQRSSANDHFLINTVRGASNSLSSNLTDGNSFDPDRLTAFTTSGFSVGTSGSLNTSGQTYVSWTFRKQPKFFDVVTYTGDSVAGRTVAHNLGSAPGMLIVKRVDSVGQWMVYHRSLGDTKYLGLNVTDAETTSAIVWNNTTPTSTVFTLGNQTNVNNAGTQYVAYLYAHDAGGFGLSGTENVISCGSYTGNGSTTGPIINLGYEPQWLMTKRADGTSRWLMLDNMRGWDVNTSNQPALWANLANAEALDGSSIQIQNTGFQLRDADPALNANGGSFIYIAIRRGPMKVPTLGTSVFDPVARAGTGTTATVTGVGFPPDLVMIKNRSTDVGGVNSSCNVFSRLTGPGKGLYTALTNAESGANAVLASIDMDGVSFPAANYSAINGSADTYINYFFGRAPSFFDEVCYTGTGVARTVAHNLAAVPELIITKTRSAVSSWVVYATAISPLKFMYLDLADAAYSSATVWNNTAPTASVFSLGTSGAANDSGVTFVAYLFATCAGVSKVGSYTGTGTTQAINCGFTAGARFVMIKRTDDVGDWYVWDSARGIVAGNDPYLLLNSTAAEVTTTDYIDPSSAGFEISSTAPAAINASGGSYIFLAVA